MAIDYRVEYVRECIKSDIEDIKREYGKDASPEIGRVLMSFISYYENKNQNNLFNKFLNNIYGLERYLRGKMNNFVSLGETRKGIVMICKALKENDKKRLGEMKHYFNELIRKELFINGMKQIFP